MTGLARSLAFSQRPISQHFMVSSCCRILQHFVVNKFGGNSVSEQLGELITGTWHTWPKHVTFVLPIWHGTSWHAFPSAVGDLGGLVLRGPLEGKASSSWAQPIFSMFRCHELFLVIFVFLMNFWVRLVSKSIPSVPLASR